MLKDLLHNGQRAQALDHGLVLGQFLNQSPDGLVELRRARLQHREDDLKVLLVLGEQVLRVQVPIVVRVSLDDAFVGHLHVLNVGVIVDVRVDYLLPDDQVELVDLKAQLSGNLGSQVAERLKHADLNADAILRVHRVYDIDLMWL